MADTGAPLREGRIRTGLSGVDLVYYGNQRQLEYDFVVAAGADPDAIALEFSGTTAMTTDATGNLILETANGRVELQAPVIYQLVDGARHEVAGRYALKASGVVAFAIADYDRTEPLVIDPVLVYSTLLGGPARTRATASRSTVRVSPT